MQLVFEQIRTGGDRNFGYLLGDRDAKQAVLIDPSYAPDLLVQRAQDQGLRVTHIINTHGHPDHTNGNDVAAARTGAPVAGHPALPATPGLALGDGEEICVGALRLRCLHGAGHSVDHVALYEPSEKILVTGDLLFVGKVGGTANDEDARTEWASLQRLLRDTTEDTTVWPGHDYGVRPSSTMGMEKRTNPFLRCPDLDAFLRLKREWPQFKAAYGLK